ncbi:unnamed protein product, partial [Closterium sp. NIES-54]
MAREFEAIKGVPAVVGAVDGTHIHKKGMEGCRAEHWTRKSAYAVQLQITCDARGIIRDYLMASNQIVGDAAYPLGDYCLTPLHALRREDLMDDWAQCFNYCQSATRMAVERCIGSFKGRWRLFAGRNNCKLWRVLAGASCCVILHNMCESMCDSKDGLSLFDLTSGASTAPAADADSTVRLQWLMRDAAARLAMRSHLPSTERAHFSQYKSAKTLYDALVARYSSPATAALSRLMLPYLFPDLAAFATVTDLITHLRTSDTRYRVSECYCSLAC